MALDLALNLALTQKASAAVVDRAVTWMLGTEGAESGWLNRLISRVSNVESDRNPNLKGWPWKPGNSSWVEPTAQALIALKKSGRKNEQVIERIRLGEAQLFDVRCRDAGWNYGSREALKIDLPSYPETTGIALCGLQGHPDLGASLDYASREVEKTNSPLGRAWLTIALRLHGARVPVLPSGPPPSDLQILALEALAAPEGNFEAFRTAAESR